MVSFSFLNIIKLYIFTNYKWGVFMEKKFIGKSGTAITFITENVNREIRKSSDLALFLA